MPSRQIRGITNVAYPVMGAADHVIAAINVPHIERIDQKVSPDIAQVGQIVGNGPSGCRRLWGTAGISPEDG